MSKLPHIQSRFADLRDRVLIARTDDGGFALAEVLVSMVILVIVGTATALVIVGGTNSATVTRTRVAAANVAQQALQQAMDLPRASLTSSTSSVPVGNATYAVTRTVSYRAGAATATACPTAPNGTVNTIVVHVSVSGGSGNQARTVAMDTVLAC